MKRYLMTLTMPICILSVAISQTPNNPIGGKPASGTQSSVTDFDYQVKYQRAFEAVLWSMSAFSIYGFHRGAEAIGAGPNVILAWSKPAKPNLEAMTGNNQVPYIVSQTDLRNGPVIIEILPASDKASLYGQIVDHWQITIADIGPSGIDKGRGGSVFRGDVIMEFEPKRGGSVSSGEVCSVYSEIIGPD